MSKITKELQDTVRGSERISHVHFNKKGEHFFHLTKIEVHKVIDQKFAESAVKKVDALPGTKYEVRRLKGLPNEPTKRVPITFELPAKTLTREEILSTKISVEVPTDPKMLEAAAKKLEQAKAEHDSNVAAYEASVAELDRVKSEQEAKAKELEEKELALMQKQEDAEIADKKGKK